VTDPREVVLRGTRKYRARIENAATHHPGAPLAAAEYAAIAENTVKAMPSISTSATGSDHIR